MKQLTVLGVLAFLLVPVLAFAQFGEVDNFFGGVIDFINIIVVPLLIAVAFVLFLYGLVVYLVSGSEDKREDGKQLMIYGIIGFVLIVSIWGIVSLIAEGLKLDEEQLTEPPEVPRQ